MNFKVAMVQMMRAGHIKSKFPELYEIMEDDFVKNFDKIMRLVKKKYVERRFIFTSVYNMSVVIEYSEVIDNLKLLYNDIIAAKNKNDI